jgi:uncharacterized protein
MDTIQGWEWVVAVVGALLIGLSKTGIPGIGIFSVALFALLVPARQSSGLVLPLLISADVVAVTAYRKHAQWNHLWGLFPWAVLGIGIGYFAMGRIDNTQTSRLIGVLLAGMVAVHLWRKRNPATDEAVPHTIVFVAAMGVLGGFTTMVANAAGPIMILYLLAMRLPKYEFIGTGAWYFFLLNCFKVPFSMNLGLINAETLRLDLMLAVFAVGGALFGRGLLPYLNEKLFESLALAFTVIAAVKLLM